VDVLRLVSHSHELMALMLEIVDDGLDAATNKNTWNCEQTRENGQIHCRKPISPNSLSQRRIQNCDAPHDADAANRTTNNTSELIIAHLHISPEIKVQFSAKPRKPAQQTNAQLAVEPAC
jgi:hypothetical protein